MLATVDVSWANIPWSSASVGVTILSDSGSGSGDTASVNTTTTSGQAAFVFQGTKSPDRIPGHLVRVDAGLTMAGISTQTFKKSQCIDWAAVR